MSDEYTLQALPPQKYRELLGTCICVFNSNNTFVIENILRGQDSDKYNWYNLVDRTSGQLCQPIQETITKSSNEKIALQFNKLIEMRNRIFHSFQITNTNGEQILRTKEKEKDGSNQFNITEEYLIEFIKENQTLSSLLYDFRSH